MRSKLIKTVLSCLILVSGLSSSLPVNAEEFDVVSHTYAYSDTSLLQEVHKVPIGQTIENVSIVRASDGRYYHIIDDSGSIHYVPTWFTMQKSTVPTRCDSSLIKPEPFIILEGNLVEDSYTTLLDKLSLLPVEIYDMFVADGFKIKLMEQDIRKEAFAGYKAPEQEVAACFDYEKKMLWIQDIYVSSILHEIGHYVNDKLGMVSSSAAFKPLFSTEARKISWYAESNDREYFAESFKMYIEHPDVLLKLSPKSYNMIQSSIEQFKSLNK